MARRTAGFTLLELLVVMAILAVAAATIGPQLWGQHEANPSRDIPRQLFDMLDKMRSDAIFQGHSQAASIDFDNNVLALRDSDHTWSPPGGWQLQPPEDGDGHPADLGDRLALEFMPDGTAKPAQFQIIGPDGQAGWTVSISAFTGRPTLKPLGADADRDDAPHG